MKNLSLSCMAFIVFCSHSTAAAADDSTTVPTTFVFPAYKHTLGIRKAGATELFLFLGLRVRFDDPQGLACVRLKSWDDPEDRHDDDELCVYGVNSGDNNIIYNSSMWGLDVYGDDVSEEQEFNQPKGICANAEGDVYVADYANHRIVKLYNPGHRLEFAASIGRRGNLPGEFEFPRQVALDNSGNIYVSDTGNNRIQVFHPDSGLRYIFPESAGLIAPNGIAVVDAAEKHRYRGMDFVFVVDSGNQRVSKFDLRGTLLARTNTADWGYPESNLEYACLDYYNQLLITDSRNHCIHKLDQDLTYIVRFGSKGEDDNQFLSPRGIAIYRRFGQLFVAEESGAQYYWIGTDVLDIAHVQQGQICRFSFRLTEPSFVNADILDADKNHVRRLGGRRLMNRAGRQSLLWDGKMGKYSSLFYDKNEYKRSTVVPSREQLPSGHYFLKISAEASYSSRSHFKKHITHRFYYESP